MIVYEYFAYMHACSHTYMRGVLRGQKQLFDSLELQLEMVVSHSVSARNCTWVLHRSSAFTC